MSVTIHDLSEWRARGRKFVMVTAYDALTARIVDDAGIPLILVGDSVANVLLGYPDTIRVTMDEMLHHARAVARGARDALLIGDMPFGSYQASRDEAIKNAASFLKAGMHAVKLEGGGPSVDLVAALTARGIPVMGHLGLTPQSVNAFGGFRVQGRDEEAAHRVVQDAKDLEAAGAFSIVLEAVPSSLAAQVTRSLQVPTIGIGAGPDCDGQVLVFHDFLGIATDYLPKFVKRYAAIGDEIKRAAAE